MNPRTSTAAVLAALGLLAAGAGSAQAGPPGKWTQVTGLSRADLNIMRLDLARTGDGVLHVAWPREGDANTGSVLHSAISANAKSVTGPHTIFANTAGGVNESVALVRAPDGSLRAFFAGTNVFDSVMASATSSDGVTWSAAGPVSRNGNSGKPVYAASGIGAGVGADGTFYTIWGDSAPGGAGFHVGLDPNAPDGSLSGDVPIDPNVGVDTQSGQVYGAWNTLGDGPVTVLSLAPAGGAIGIPNSAPQTQHRVGITGRIGSPGVFVAYTQGSNPFLAKPAVYRVDTGKSTRLSRSQGELISIAAAPAGRLWVFWEKGGTIFATRSNKAATKWGRIVKLRAPGKSSSVYSLAGEGTLGPLDLLAHTDPPSGNLASFHQRILPGLLLKARKNKKGNTVIKVSDAGEGVAGAKVKVKGVGSQTTGAGGVTTFALAPGRYRVRASKNGYDSHTRRVRVR